MSVELTTLLLTRPRVHANAHARTHTHTHTHIHTLTHSLTLTHARHQAQTRPHSRRPCCGAQTSSTGFGVVCLGLRGCVLGCYRPRTWRPCCGAQISVPGTTRLCPAAPPASCPPSQPSLSLVTEASHWPRVQNTSGSVPTGHQSRRRSSCLSLCVASLCVSLVTEERPPATRRTR